MRVLVILVMLGTSLAACTREAVPPVPVASAPTASAASASPAPVASSKPTSSAAPPAPPPPFLAEGCPPGQHDVGGWKRIDVAAVTSDQRSSLNNSPCSWDVFVRDGVAVAEAHRRAEPKIPPGLRYPNRWGPPRSIVRGRSGLLVGFNKGEWGGALRWYSNSGALRGELLNDNVIDLLSVTNGFIVFTGLSHLGSDEGRATELIDTGTVFRIGRSADLGSEPRAFVLESDGAGLVVTTVGMSRISPSFQVTRLLSTSWGMFYPVSLVLDGATAYVGMRGLVVKVELGAATPTETWLSPVDFE